MYLTDLADVLRKAGLTVVEVPGWKTRGYRRKAPDGAYRADLLGVESIVIHHTATPQSVPGDYPTLATVRDGRSDVAGPLSQLGLGRSGTWYVIAAGYANHTGVTFHSFQSNSYAIGIEAEAAGTGDPRDWPQPQMDSYAKGVRALAGHYGVLVERVQGHKEIAAPTGRKTDPSFDMGAFRNRVRSVNNNPGGLLMALNDEQQDEFYRILTEKISDVAAGDGLDLGSALARLLVIARRSERRLMNSALRENRLIAALEAATANLGAGQEAILAAVNEALDAIGELDDDLPESVMLTAVAPASGPVAGGTAVTATGLGFTHATRVDVGGAAATDFVVASDTSITFVTPAGEAGARNVAVRHPAGDAILRGGFTYTA
jgi:hypothetical protein